MIEIIFLQAPRGLGWGLALLIIVSLALSMSWHTVDVQQAFIKSMNECRMVVSSLPFSCFLDTPPSNPIPTELTFTLDLGLASLPSQGGTKLAARTWKGSEMAKTDLKPPDAAWCGQCLSQYQHFCI